MMKY